MTPDVRAKLKSLLMKHEGFRQFVYTDTTSHLTIGFGRNLSDRGISSTEAMSLLDDDIFYFSSKLSHLLPYWDSIDAIRQIVLIDMCFNLGVNGLLQFQAMLTALQNKDYNFAAEEILNSKAHEQCPERYEQLAYIMKTGEL